MYARLILLHEYLSSFVISIDSSIQFDFFSSSSFICPTRNPVEDASRDRSEHRIAFSAPTMVTVDWDVPIEMKDTHSNIVAVGIVDSAEVIHHVTTV